MEIIKFKAGDILVMKKQHPCGSHRMRVVRTGSDIRVVCMGCQRDMTIPREKLEKHIKEVEYAE